MKHRLAKFLIMPSFPASVSMIEFIPLRLYKEIQQKDLAKRLIPNSRLHSSILALMKDGRSILSCLIHLSR